MNNKANREVCDVDIRVLSTMKPYLFFDTANETGLEISGDDTYAMAKGSRKIAFSNPMESTMTITAQVVPFKFYAMLSDGVIDTEAAYAEKSTIKANVAGQLTIPSGAKAGTLFVYKTGEYAETAIEGTFSGTTFTATTETNIAIGESYDVGYVVVKSTGVQKIAFNNKRNPLDYYITMLTNDKDEAGVLVPKRIVCYKAKPVRSATFTYSSEGDPVSVELQFTCLEDKDGNIVDMVEITE